VLVISLRLLLLLLLLLMFCYWGSMLMILLGNWLEWGIKKGMRICLIMLMLIF